MAYTKPAPSPVYNQMTEDEVGQDERLATHLNELSPRYPLRKPDAIRLRHEGEGIDLYENECISVDPMNNISLMAEEGDKGLYADHPWKPKGRRS